MLCIRLYNICKIQDRWLLARVRRTQAKYLTSAFPASLSLSNLATFLVHTNPTANFSLRLPFIPLIASLISTVESFVSYSSSSICDAFHRPHSTTCARKRHEIGYQPHNGRVRQHCRKAQAARASRTLFIHYPCWRSRCLDHMQPGVYLHVQSSPLCAL